jgi:hypothetical protein
VWSSPRRPTSASASVCYDGLVYTVPDLTHGRIVVKDVAAIEALNELQNLKAAENIYFSNWEDRHDVRDQFLAVKDNRPKEWSVVKHLVPVGVENGYEQYREGTLAEAKKAGKSLVRLSFKYPRPTRWFPAIKFRSKPKTFHNGTGVGHVRKAEWLSSRRSPAGSAGHSADPAAIGAPLPPGEVIPPQSAA